MDLTKVQGTQNPVNKDIFSPNKLTTVKGGTIVAYKDMHGTIIDKLDETQLYASQENPDLRKRLRIDRVRKMTLGASAAGSSIEDVNQPEWDKRASLRDIQTIRETKKNEMVNSIFGTDSNNDFEKLAIIPGRPSVVTVPIKNDSQYEAIYQFTFRDSEDSFALDEPEFKIPKSPEEQT